MVQGGDVVALLLGYRGLRQGGRSRGPVWPPPCTAPPGARPHAGQRLQLQHLGLSVFLNQAVILGEVQGLSRSIVATDTMNCR